ncbi:MAG: MBL fold metallo-hydrolase [Planctomycetota bacterium]|nr:MAG: MBL fold metallo-hydrolase [Planctomycetota bacterium]
MEILLLASGSSGNCALIRAGLGSQTTTVVLDCGIAQRTARDLARTAGAQLTSADAVLLSHGHSDHAANVVPVAARAKAPLFAHPDALLHSSATRESERKRRKIQDRPFESGSPFVIGALQCTPIRLSHDAEPTHGFLFEADGLRAGFFTDLGETESLPSGLLDGLDFLVLEFNHDTEMLRNGPYPPHLQDRIAGPQGHLSNAQAERYLAEQAPSSLKQLALAHLSQKNNAPGRALHRAERALKARGLTDVDIQVAQARGLLRLAL